MVAALIVALQAARLLECDTPGRGGRTSSSSPSCWAARTAFSSGVLSRTRAKYSSLNRLTRLILAASFSGIDVLGVVGDPQLAALVERLACRRSARRSASNFLVAVDVAIDVRRPQAESHSAAAAATCASAAAAEAAEPAVAARQTPAEPQPAARSASLQRPSCRPAG